MDPGFVKQGNVGTAQFGGAALLVPAHASKAAGGGISYGNSKSSKVTRNISSSHKFIKIFMLLL